MTTANHITTTLHALPQGALSIVTDSNTGEIRFGFADGDGVYCGVTTNTSVKTRDLAHDRLPVHLAHICMTPPKIVSVNPTSVCLVWRGDVNRLDIWCSLCYDFMRRPAVILIIEPLKLSSYDRKELNLAREILSKAAGYMQNLSDTLQQLKPAVDFELSPHVGLIGRNLQDDAHDIASDIDEKQAAIEMHVRSLRLELMAAEYDRHSR